MSDRKLSTALIAAIALLTPVAGPLADKAFAADAAVGAQTPSTAIIDTLQKVIVEGYHNAERGREIARRLEGLRVSGRYREVLDQDRLASKLTDDLREISGDDHFMVIFEQDAAADAVPGRGGRPPQRSFAVMPEAEGAFLRADGYGVRGVERLDGNIGRIDIRAFAGPYPEVRQRYAAIMEFVRDTDGLIIDLTRNGGGSVHMVNHFLSYFFNRPAFLTKSIEWRTQGSETFVSVTALEGPSYGEERPVVVAVSNTTFSGGEELAYDLQVFGRATVVGQVTRGGANPIASYELGEGFRVTVPTGLVTNPVTGGNWEGAGVQPDLAVSPERTLACSHATALRQALALKPSDRDEEKTRTLARLGEACAA
ncbi:S41 family peptidase [Roseibacterium beibuensis]|uniref:S41 family peptidase n=1 Tax=[Roseibacterium] beibuensis TaxID=1193142 RepID=UPI00217E640F|nr:S41 family peptidase [Roseibacterium beibuensis]MCS6627622.1 S41 family peptidase [Roseibacterium beibuensis]